MATAQQIIDIVRETLDDTEGPVLDRLWSDATLLEYLNDAERESCTRKDLLVDATTPSVSQVSISAGTATYNLDTKIINVARAKTTTSNGVLHRTTREVLDLTDSAWESESGVPRAYILEETLNIKKLTLYPNPDAIATLNMTVVRLPLVDMTLVDTPEIAEYLQSDLKYWVLFRAFQKQDTKVNQDAKTVGVTKERYYEGLFEKTFGPKRMIVNGFLSENLLVR